jgi:hypothetical protein
VSRTKKIAKKQLGFGALSLSLSPSLSIPPLFFWVEGFLALFEEKRRWGRGGGVGMLSNV